jgi:hypothetical protein
VVSAVAFDTELVAERHAVRLWVPAEHAAALGTARLLPATVTINGHAVPTTLHKMDGGYMMAVNKTVQAAIGVTTGDTVHVTVEPDDTPRTVEVPDDLATALAEATTQDAFDSLSPFRQNEIVKNVTSAKRPDTRARRIARAVEQLTTRPRP